MVIEKIHAPFSPGTVKNLEQFQKTSTSRYVCVRRDKHGGDGILEVSEDGFRCPQCNLTQTWAHGWTALPDPF